MIQVIYYRIDSNKKYLSYSMIKQVKNLKRIVSKINNSKLG